VGLCTTITQATSRRTCNSSVARAYQKGYRLRFFSDTSTSFSSPEPEIIIVAFFSVSSCVFAPDRLSNQEPNRFCAVVTMTGFTIGVKSIALCLYNGLDTDRL